VREDREGIARRIAEDEGAVVVPPFDDPHIIAGQGTCGLELFEEVPDLDALVTPCGGGGLFAGASVAAKAFNPGVECFAVEPEAGDDVRRSFLTGGRVSIPVPDTIADGARTQSPGELTLPVVLANASDVLTVTDAELIEAMKFLLFRLKILAEPTGALAAAAVLFSKVPPHLRRIGVVISGGNVDPDALARLVTAG
jgi:threonine dehydratase